MRKDRLSSYQAKKEKLQKIKIILSTPQFDRDEIIGTVQNLAEAKIIFDRIWKLVKDE